MRSSAVNVGAVRLCQVLQEVNEISTDDLRGTCVESGAHIPEENPDELVTALTEFLGNAPQEAARHKPQA